MPAQHTLSLSLLPLHPSLLHSQGQLAGRKTASFSSAESLGRLPRAEKSFLESVRSDFEVHFVL